MRHLLTSSVLVCVALAGCERLPWAGADALGPEGDGHARNLSRPDYSSADLPDDPSDHVEGRIVVDFVDGTTQAEIDALEQSWGIDLQFNSAVEGPASGIADATTLGLSQAELDTLLRQIRLHPLVEAAEELMTVRLSPPKPTEAVAPQAIPFKPGKGFMPNDPMFERQWNLAMIEMPAAWEVTRGKGVVVAVLDTGIAWENHDDFAQVPDLSKSTFVEGWDFVNDDQHANDDHGHGTHVAGTIAQSTNNGEGVAGVAFEATLMPVKVLDHFGSGNTADIADAIHWAADHGAKVLNLSLGGGGRSQVMENAVTYARSKGVVVVCAAGNGGRGVVEFPAAYPGSFAVAAVGPSGARAPYSSWGKELDLAAPGGDKSQGEAAGVLQNTIDPQDVSRNVYASYQGTSMATPHVAGVAALLFAAGAKTPDDVEQALIRSATLPAGATGWTDQYGHGVLNARAALEALKSKRTAEAPAAQQQGDDVGVFSYRAGSFGALGLSVMALAFVLLSMTRKERPGYLNVLVRPLFLVPLLLTTVGVFVVQYFAAPSEVTSLITLPLPDWLNKIIFGRGALANPIVYSAAIPIVVSLFAIRLKGLRPMVGGLALGFAGILGYSAWAHAPALAWLPFTFLAIPWLVVNALICLFVARAMLKREKV